MRPYKLKQMTIRIMAEQFDANNPEQHKRLNLQFDDKEKRYYVQYGDIRKYLKEDCWIVENITTNEYDFLTDDQFQAAYELDKN